MLVTKRRSNHAISKPIARPQGKQQPARKGAANLFSAVMPDGAWKDRRCFIIGGGPSLVDFDWSRLDGELVIGINRAFEKIDPTIIYSMDARFWGWLEQGKISSESLQKFNDSQAYKVWLDTVNFPFPPDIFTIPCAGVNDFPRSLKDGMGGGCNSGYGAINLAYALGANPIYLLGYDMLGDGHGKQAWWHKGYPAVQRDNVYARFIKYISSVAPILKDAGVRVVNLNPYSGLSCFEFGSMGDIASVSRPLVVCYYTTGTGYEREVVRLKASLKRLGMQSDIEGVPNLGSWQKNTMFKATFIKRMQEKHPGRALLFVDADAEIMRYPALLDNLTDVDVAVHYRDWGARRPLRKPSRELLSGTLYLGATENARRIVEAWVGENRRRPTGVWEQQNLQDVLERTPDKRVMELPAAYTCIFDQMPEVEEPVILHLQKSREYKREVGL